MRVKHCVPSLDPVHGGPSRTVVALTDALARTGELGVELVAQGPAGGAIVPAAGSAVSRRVRIGRGRLELAWALPMRRDLAAIAPAGVPDLVHGHGVWHPAGHWAARAARRWRVPLVLHPRGMLEPWALEQKPFKKRLALVLFQWRDLRTSRVLVATSETEYEHLRVFGLRQPVAVIPNGVAAVAEQDVKGASALARKDRQRIALFLSRVHPKKGVLELVRAWAEVSPVGWRLVIAGPDEAGHWGEVARLIDRLGVGGSIDYLGSVDGTAKAALFNEADLFVLPTFSENFGVVVAEALAHGLPVVTTRGAPWADLEVYGCGWWIDTGVDPLVLALRQAAALGDAERRVMGERGQAYVQRYDWDRIAEQTLALYRWVLGRGEQPACVHLD